jgi:hypothetical protein
MKRLLTLAALASACGEQAPSDRGLQALLRIDGAQFYPRPIAAESGGPEVVSMNLPSFQIQPGSRDHPVTGALEPDATSAIIALGHDVGYWVVPAKAPDVASPEYPTFEAMMEFSSRLAPGDYQLRVQASDDQGRLGKPRTQTLHAMPAGAPSGTLVIQLSWDTEADLDLHVVTPDDQVLSATGLLEDLGAFTTIPRYDDAQAKVSWKIGRREQLSAAFLHSSDAFHRDIPSAGPGGSSRQTFDRSFQRYYFTYVRLPDERTRVSVTPYYGFDHDRTGTVFQGIATNLAVESVRYGVRAARDERFGDHLSITTGADVEGVRSNLSRAGSLTLPSREGDISVFGQPPGTDVNTDRWQTHVAGVAPFVTARIAFGPVAVTPGLRLDGYFIQTSRKAPPIGAAPVVGTQDLTAALEPRISVEYQASKRLSFNGAAGVYHAPPAPEDLSAVFGTPALTLSSARHASLGQAFALTDTTRLEIVEYAEWLSRLAVRTRRDSPSLARALVQDGEGRNYGVQVTLRQELWKGLSGWAAYTLSRSERRFAGDATYRSFDYDRTHVVSIAASQEVSSWTFGARVQYATGLPRTPVVGAYFNASSGRDEPLFGAQNSTRLPPFFQLDLRVDRRFALSEGVELRIYVEAANLTARKNPEEVIYNSTYTKRVYATGLPPLLLVGARLDF